MDHSEVKHLPKVDHTPNELDAAGKLLLAGAALIEERGHHKGSYQNSAGGLCFRGSLHLALCGDAGSGGPLADEAAIRLLHYLDAPSGGWIFWNDAPHRTPGEVIAAMRAAAFTKVSGAPTFGRTAA